MLVNIPRPSRLPLYRLSIRPTEVPSSPSTPTLRPRINASNGSPNDCRPTIALTVSTAIPNETLPDATGSVVPRFGTRRRRFLPDRPSTTRRPRFARSHAERPLPPTPYAHKPVANVIRRAHTAGATHRAVHIAQIALRLTLSAVPGTIGCTGGCGSALAAIPIRVGDLDWLDAAPGFPFTQHLSHSSANSIALCSL